MTRELEVVDELRPLFDLLREKHPNLNDGGCGLFAHCFSEFREVEIFITSFDDYTKEQNIENLNQGNYEDVRVRHIVLKYKGVLIDGHGLYLNEHGKELTPLTKKELRTILFDRERGWNEIFWGSNTQTFFQIQEAIMLLTYQIRKCLSEQEILA